MVKQETPKKPVPQDWHKADIKAALEKAGWSLRGLARHHGLEHGAVTIALYKPYPKAEKRIADAIGLKPYEIWPTRYNADGTPRGKRGNPNWLPGVPRRKNDNSRMDARNVNVGRGN
jgi:Ner family transcriptional regulator